VLDGGAYGVICPMVNTREEAQALVSYCRYPPKGQRSNGPIRAAMYGVAGEYQKTANDEILVIPMIETRQAVENIDDILDVRGIDAIYVGPADLAFSLGKTPKLDSEDSEQLGMYESVLAACRKRGIYPGIHCGEPAYAAHVGGPSLNNSLSYVPGNSVTSCRRAILNLVAGAIAVAVSGCAGCASQGRADPL